MASNRDRWSSRTKFVLAAVGCSVGLGNVWRFPAVAYANGGGAFLLPFIIALVTAGIPLLILEFGVGQKFQKAAPQAIGEINRNLKWLGWWAVGISMVIVVYYAVIMAWGINYMLFSVQQTWKGDADNFFWNTFLQVTEGPGQAGSINWQIFTGLLIVWVAIYMILEGGLESVGKIVLWTVPVPVVLLLILVVRGVTLPGAIEGIKYFITPDFSCLLDPKVWLAAYGQVFFSIGVGWGIMIAYASWQSPKGDINKNSMITVLLDGGISYIAGFAVFSIVGYLAQIQNVAVPDAVVSGIGLAFVAYPTAISQMPVLPEIFGIIFFLMLLTLGIDSAFAMVEAVVAAITDSWKVPRKLIVAIICAIGFILGIPFTFGFGIHWLDIVDHWAADYGLALVGLLQCILVGWLFNIEDFRKWINSVSDFSVGKWWSICIKWFTPFMLIVMTGRRLIADLSENYGNYPSWSLVVGGWGITVILIITGLILQKKGK